MLDTCTGDSNVGQNQAKPTYSSDMRYLVMYLTDSTGCCTCVRVIFYKDCMEVLCVLLNHIGSISGNFHSLSAEFIRVPAINIVQRFTQNKFLV